MTESDSHDQKGQDQESDPSTPQPDEQAVAREARPEPVSKAEPPAEGSDGDPDGRRAFLQKAGSIVLGAGAFGAPVAIGVKVVAGGLFESQTGGILAYLTSLEALVPGGPPQAFKVVADKSDAWTTYQDLPLGLVFVQRGTDDQLAVFSASCPHAGCAVEYRREGAIKGEELSEHYFCPCHDSAFALDGEIASAGSPAKRGLDSLEVDQDKLRSGEVWIRFQRFKAGVVEKEAIT